MKARRLLSLAVAALAATMLLASPERRPALAAGNQTDLAPAKPQAKPPAKPQAKPAANPPAKPAAKPAAPPRDAAETEQQLQRLTEEERALHGDLARAADAMTALEADIAGAEADLRKALDEEAAIRKQLQGLEGKEKAAVKDLSALLRQLWPVHVRNLAHQGQDLDSWEEADRLFVWMSEVYAVVDDGMRQLQAVRAPLEQTLAEHRKAQEEARTRLRAVNVRKDQLLKDRLAFDGRLAALRKEKRGVEEELKAILAAAASVNYTLEQRLDNLDAPADNAAPQAGAPDARNKTAKPDKPAALPDKLARLPVGQLKGKLPWPSQGTLAMKFKPEADPPLRGLALKTEDKTPVRAVAGGKVVHDDTLRGFGRVVILVHGDDYFSLYAYLAESAVKVGQEVAMGDTLGLAGHYPDLKGPGLYFELRFHQKAINPESWLAARQ